MEKWKKTFLLIWVGQFISLLTSSTVTYSAFFWLSLETKSPEVLAYAVLSGYLPQAILGMFIGAYVDKWHRKTIMIVSDLFIAFCTLILIILFLSGNVQLGYIYALFACRSIGTAFHTPAMQASIPLLAPKSELSRIAGINQSIHSFSGIVAPVIGATLISFGRIEYILFLDIIGAVFACLLLSFVYIPNPINKKVGNSLFQDVKECILLIHSKKGMPYIFICSALVTFSFMLISVLLPLMTIEHFNGSPFQMGLIEMLWGIGALAGGITMGIKRLNINKVTLVNIMYLLFGGYLVISGILSENAFVCFALLTVIGGCSYAIYNAIFLVIIQLQIEEAFLGRVISTYNSLILLPSIAGIVGTGIIAEHIGIANVFIIAGIVSVFTGFISLFVPSARKLGSDSPIQ